MKKIKKTTEDDWFDDFSRDARYMKDSLKLKYNIRFNGKFICAESPEALFKKYKEIRRKEQILNQGI